LDIISIYGLRFSVLILSEALNRSRRWRSEDLLND
jgi:hypothetical protein